MASSSKNRTPARGGAPSRRSLWLRRLAMAGLAVGVVLGVTLAWLYHRHVVLQPGEHLSRDAVLGVIAQESPVYYRDGHTRVGVFFEDEHRRFVSFEELPLAWRAGIVAAEDGHFWSHPGFDPRHIARAMRDNLMAGELVAGGSTLTQQTAKNLYYRPDRTLRSKLIEALNALRLERHFTKSEILTFYANQFHVAGNGRGLGIAARHFFDVEPDELSVLQSAFLAGLVKAPAYYDPFVGDEARRARALERAHARTRYVLGRIVEEEAETLAGPYPTRGSAEEQRAYEERVAEVKVIAAEAQRLLAEGFELPFRRGVFRFDSSALLDEVERRLGEAPFAEVLQKAGIDDPATAGLKVVTTLDAEAQRAATYGLWHHLTEVGTMMEALTAADFRRPADMAPRFDPDHPPRVWDFRHGLVDAVEEVGGKRVLRVDLGGHPCLVDRDAIVRAALAVARGAEASASAKVKTEGVEALVDALPVGSVVWVSVREVGAKGAVCDLEVRPELQGSTVVLENGRVLAMVGGNDNRNFNRASALRQMGSTWKPLVYHAALRLGWNTTDLLDNRRAVFPFSTTFYYPRPDHAPDEEVTLAWAGVTSENVASVWLLYHMLDRLDLAATTALVEQFGLARAADEDASDYALRIQRAGVLPSPSRVHEALFLEARHEVLASLPRSAHPGDAVALMSLLYGWGFEGERRNAGEDWQQAALDWSWPVVKDLGARCVEQRRLLDEALNRGEVPAPELMPDLRLRKDPEGALRLACGPALEGYEVPTLASLTREEEGPEGVDPGQPTPEGVPEVDAPGRRGWPWPQQPKRQLRRLDLPAEGELLIGGRLHLATVQELGSALERLSLRREVQGEEAPGPYDPAVLYWHQDLRVLLALKVVRKLAETFGVRTEVREVISMPLGASEITLEEAAKVYEGLTSGRAWRFPGEATSMLGGTAVGEPLASTLLIAEIRDVDDRVLYRAVPVADEISDVGVAAMTTDVLEQVVAWGTGKRAHQAVSIAGHALPLAGKTGTTNDFRNAAFVGLAPIVTGSELTVGRAAVVATYVGYDDNRPMVNGRIKLAGASGALPAWLTTVQGLASLGMLGTEGASPSEQGWKYVDPEGFVRVPVDSATGLPSSSGASLAMVLARGVQDQVATLDVDPSGSADRPVRDAPSTVDIETVLQQRKNRGAEGSGSVWGPNGKRRQADP
jgi:penicillin-binding protein 1A